MPSYMVEIVKKEKYFFEVEVYENEDTSNDAISHAFEEPWHWRKTADTEYEVKARKVM